MTEVTLKKTIFSLLLVLALFSLSGIVSGLEVQTSIIIQGEGVIDKEAGANTEAGLAGIKYSEWIHTQSLGLYGPSEVNYTSDFLMIAETKENTTINSDSAFELSNIYQKASIKDYPLRTVQSFWTRGDTEAIALFAVDNHSSSFDFAQTLSGTGGYYLSAKNITDWHTKAYFDTANYNGTYDILLGSFFGEPYYPAAGISDWLLCPSSVPIGEGKP